MAGSILFGVSLILLAALLVWHHQGVWNQACRYSPSAREKDFARRQYRRRTQTSTMIGIVGIAIGAHPWVTNRTAAVVYVVGLLACVGWILLLGCADMFSSWVHFQQLRRRQQAEHAALQAQLKREAERRRGEQRFPESPDESSH